MRILVCAVAFSSLAACTRAAPPIREPAANRGDSQPETRAASNAGGAPEAAASPVRPTTTAGEPALRTLDIPGFDSAIVSFPSGGAANQPVLIAAHGAGDNPAWQCESWRELLGDRAIILCLSGPRVAVRSDARYFPDHFALEKIALASIEALRRVLPDPAAASRIVYTGYSQGATMGALMIVTHGDKCPRLVLVEGGFDGWTLGRVEKFKSTGGERVLFVCGTAHCRKKAEASAQTLERGGVASRVVTDLSAGHNYGAAVARVLEESFGWLVDGDAAWAPPH